MGATRRVIQASKALCGVVQEARVGTRRGPSSPVAARGARGASFGTPARCRRWGTPSLSRSFSLIHGGRAAMARPSPRPKDPLRPQGRWFQRQDFARVPTIFQAGRSEARLASRAASREEVTRPRAKASAAT